MQSLCLGEQPVLPRVPESCLGCRTQGQPAQPGLACCLCSGMRELPPGDHLAGGSQLKCNSPSWASCSAGTSRRNMKPVLAPSSPHLFGEPAVPHHHKLLSLAPWDAEQLPCTSWAILMPSTTLGSGPKEGPLSRGRSCPGPWSSLSLTLVSQCVGQKQG